MIIDEEKKRLNQAALDLEAKSPHHLERNERSESLASIVLEQLRSSDEPLIWRKKSSKQEQSIDQSGDKQLILPDCSILEEYVRRKRDRFERLHSEPPIMESEKSRCSPCLSTASELIPASAVRVYESARNIPFITAPSRSRLSSVESSRPSPPPPPVRDNSKMLDLLSYGEQMLSASYHSLKNSQLNRNQRSASLTIKPTFSFDPPLSPFEERLQHQAHQLRRSSGNCDISPFSEGDAFVEDGTLTLDVTMQLPVRIRNRRPSADGSGCSGAPITSNFEAAAAAASHPRHERYAAHIPVKGCEGGSGRISSASIDSVNSVALDSASRQVDEMIDQARYRHQHHRSKFKEAIDYLDQVFEDLKKECDTPSGDVSRPSRPNPTKSKPINALPQKVTPKTTFQSPPANMSAAMAEAKTRIRKQPEARQPTVNHANQPSSATQSSRAPSVRQKPKVPEQSPPENFEQTSEDVEVSETIILPCPDRKLRGDRLDFTRKWLAGDIKSWASVQPRPDLLLGGLEEEPTDYEFDERSIGSCSAEVAAINSIDRKKKKIRETPDLLQNEPTDYEFDERSIGSCSAEVAAINSIDRKKKKIRETPDLLQNVASPAKPARRPNSHQYKYDRPTQLTPIKPQPVRPQPVYGLATSSSSNNFNSYPRPFREASGRVSNEDQLNGGQCDLKRVSSHNQIPERKRSGEVPSWRSTSQEAFNTLASVRSEENGVTRRSGAFAQYNPSTSVSTGGSVNSLPDAGLIMSSQPARQPDPILAIDALVAELELNTDEANVTEKRRSFPTRLETLSNRFPECEQSRSSRQRTNGDKIAKTSWTDRGARRVQQQKMAFDEMTSMLRSVAGDINSNGQPGLRKRDQFPPAPGTILSPFETINQEKLNPSKVEAIQLMFESKQGVPPTWRRNVLRGRRTSGEEDTYYEINEFSKNRKEQSPPYSRPLVKPQSPVVRGAFVALSQPQKRNPSHAAAVHVQPAQQDFVPALPVTQPPSHPPGKFFLCSANSSQAGGYYSSGSSLGAPSSYTPSHHQSSLPRSSTSGRRGSLIGKQSTSSRPASFEDEDDGFYDNIQDRYLPTLRVELISSPTCETFVRKLEPTINEHRFSRSSEADNASVNSHRLPPSSKAGGEGGTRFGHFLRRIGSSKPPAAAASLMSLNKVANENVSGHAPLMKSNSLSDEPWKTQVIAKAHATTRRGKLITLISFDPLICQRPA
ncbi:hypothetical protein Tcan_09901 [Toxocara canis]|uniref:Uncharacterized protein n=1 Tax=Toxocara canis TaxID=6265 RepID=A0A0B2VGS5_TOXCA|nr:hypothetical protein Tcan_09901 [Toxocara canis]